MKFKKFNIVCGNWDDFFFHPERPPFLEDVTGEYWPESGGGIATFPPYKQIERAKEAVEIFNGNDHRFTLVATNSIEVIYTFTDCIFAFQIAQRNPANAEKIAEIVPREHWLDPALVSCYCVLGNVVTDMLINDYGVWGSIWEFDTSALENGDHLETYRKLCEFLPQ